MKKILLSVFAMASATLANAQCNELFMSEYIEGSQFNKAIEIYNPTSDTISLENYRFVRYDNGSTVPGGGNGDGILPFAGSGLKVLPKKVIVITLNTTAQGTELPPDPALAALADAQFGTSCVPGAGVIRALCFNGDDALALEKNVSGTWNKVDIFAVIGDRPTNGNGLFSPTGGWTNVAPHNTGVGSYWTIDQTLVRKSTVTSGTSTNPSIGAWNPAAEWDSLPENTFNQLKTHTCDCATASINDFDKDEATTVLFPNPANSQLRIQAINVISTISVIDLLGREVMTVNQINNKDAYLNIDNLEQGIYSTQVHFANGKVITKKLKVIK